MRTALALAVATLLFAGACSTPLPPEFQLDAPLDRSQPPVVFVSAAELRGTIDTSLERAGFAITQSGREATLVVTA